MATGDTIAEFGIDHSYLFDNVSKGRTILLELEARHGLANSLIENDYVVNWFAERGNSSQYQDDPG